MQMNGTSLDGTVWLTWMSWVEEPGTMLYNYDLYSITCISLQ